MAPEAQLVLLADPTKAAPLDRSRPTTIGRAADNRLRLVSQGEVDDHHAVVRFSQSQGWWLVCDWQSRAGTYLEKERVHQCRRLGDGDQIRLGPRGPVLVFQLLTAATAPAATGAPGAPRASGGSPPPSEPVNRAGARAAPAAATLAATPGAPVAVGQRPRKPDPQGIGQGTGGAPITLGGRAVPLDQVLSAQVRSRPRHPHSFSWWLLLCLGGMVLLPIPPLFWSLQIGALAAWILLGSRKEHVLVVTLRDGMAHRHGFSNRITALSHRNGIRKALGQSTDQLGGRARGQGPASG